MDFFFHQAGSGSKKKSQYILRCIEQKRSLVNQVAEIVSILEKYNQTKKGLSKYIFFIYLNVKKWQVQSILKTKFKIQIVFDECGTTDHSHETAFNKQPWSNEPNNSPETK